MESPLSIFDDGLRLNNPADPLSKVSTKTGKQLFEEMARLAKDMPRDLVMNAVASMLVSVIRQDSGNGRAAEAKMAEVYGKMQDILAGCFDPVTGKKRNIFPFTQNISPTMVVDKDRMLS